MLDGEGEYKRLGEATKRTSDFRLVAATNRELGALKHDLLARLKVRVGLPSLRERREDVPLLVRALVLEAAKATPKIAGRFVTEVRGRMEVSVRAGLVDALVPSADRRQTPKSRSERAATSSLASALFLSPNTLSVKHWNRLEEGLLLATTPRIAWPMLLRRCFSVDVLECARCGGRLRVMAVVTAEATVSKILDHLNMRSVPPPVARARAPDDVGEQIELGW